MGEEEETQDERRHIAVYEVQVTRVLCKLLVWHHSEGIQISTVSIIMEQKSGRLGD